MCQLGTRNFGAYARWMLIDGCIIKVDYTEQKKPAAADVHPPAAGVNGRGKKAGYLSPIPKNIKYRLRERRLSAIIILWDWAFSLRGLPRRASPSYRII